MAKVLKAPGKYVQGPGELKNLGVHVKKTGTRFAVILSENGEKRFGETIRESLRSNGYESRLFRFRGECSLEEIDRLAENILPMNCDAVIAVGGGKALDTGKAVAVKLDVAVIIVPTVASNDAPCSGLSVVYDDQGNVCKVIYARRNPDLVLVDSEIILHAPARLLAAGMGDALATCYETRAAAASGAVNMVRGTATHAAVALSDACLKLLLENGVQAMEAVKNQTLSEAFESVLEASILLSGIGFESGGLAVAHAFHDSIAGFAETHEKYHGEKVAFGTLVQLILEKRSDEEIEKIFSFCKRLGLPITLEELGITENVDEKVQKAGRRVCHPKQFGKNMPFPVCQEDIVRCIYRADEYGKSYLKGNAYENKEKGIIK